MHVEQIGSPAAGFAHLLQRTAYFGLKHNHQSHKANLQNAVQHPAHRAHIGEVCHQIQHQHKNNAARKLPNMGLFDQHDQLVDHHCSDQNIQKVRQLEGLEVVNDFSQQIVLQHHRLQSVQHEGAPPLWVRFHSTVLLCEITIYYTIYWCI